MGDVLNQQVLQSFMSEVDFLEKIAELRKEALSPASFTKWLKPSTIGRGLSTLGRGGLHHAGEGLGGIGKFVADIPAATRETMELAAHPIQSMRKGWGESTWGLKGHKGALKYLPLGAKSMTLGFAIPDIMDTYAASKNKPTPTGEGGVAETALRGLGGTAGFLAGMASKRNLIPGLGLMMGAQYAGGKMGRIIDRLRGGASLGTAVGAPSPIEAESQLEDLQRYYG